MFTIYRCFSLKAQIYILSIRNFSFPKWCLCCTYITVSIHCVWRLSTFYAFCLMSGYRCISKQQWQYNLLYSFITEMFSLQTHNIIYFTEIFSVFLSRILETVIKSCINYTICIHVKTFITLQLCMILSMKRYVCTLISKSLEVVGVAELCNKLGGQYSICYNYMYVFLLQAFWTLQESSLQSMIRSQQLHFQLTVESVSIM